MSTTNRTRVTARTRALASLPAALLVVGALASCGDASRAAPALSPTTAGSVGSPGAGSSHPATRSEPPLLSDLLWATATVLQRSPEKEPELCLGVVLESYPPQCGGPRLVGWDWDDVSGETTHAGVTWVDTIHVVGTLAGDTFTLRRPPSATRPVEAGPDPSPTQDDFPELCDDPLRGAAESARAGAGTDSVARDALSRALEAMPGYVASWVSDGQAFMNVVVTGDAERARADARRLWAGKLCVERRDVATQAEMLAAQEALTPLATSPQRCLGSSPGADGRLRVAVTVADPETVAAVHRAVAPWLSPAEVVISARLRPLGG